MVKSSCWSLDLSTLAMNSLEGLPFRHVFCCNVWRTRLVVLCNAVQRMKQKASFASAIVVAMFGNKFAYGQTELVLRQRQSVLCHLHFPVQFISETWSKWVRRGKQLRHKKGRLDTRSSENTQSKRDVLKFYSMSAPLLQKCVTLLQSKLEMQGTPQLSLLESPFVSSPGTSTEVLVCWEGSQP